MQHYRLAEEVSSLYSFILPDRIGRLGEGLWLPNGSLKHFYRDQP